MKFVSVHEVKTHLSSLLAEIEQSSERIVICRRGMPVSDLVPHRIRNRLDPHSVMSDIGIDYAPTELLADDESPHEGVS